ncbi:hypothetical protein DFH08DRAFT_943676 [Mycena albidolilacea]|uniref:Uncharacterized protein n=1 Tax=Mycena albidolilacea TaxID=1033008 RepID=A0AAD7ECQ7_9AGAR|nr:hypothetical protein DFH08DRAFT_943676 [Mycena albidolilacea]
MVTGGSPNNENSKLYRRYHPGSPLAVAGGHRWLPAAIGGYWWTLFSNVYHQNHRTPPITTGNQRLLPSCPPTNSTGFRCIPLENSGQSGEAFQVHMKFGKRRTSINSTDTEFRQIPMFLAGTRWGLLLSDRPLDKKLLAELKSIASAMGLEPGDLKKLKILASIRAHIKSVPEIADDPRFLPLFSHRTAPGVGGKTSTGKAAEEAVESAKPKQVATGANKALLSSGVKTDPPPQYKMLFSGARNEKQATADASDLSDTTGDESCPPTPSPAPKPESNTEFIKQKIERKHGMSGVVRVNFFDQSNHSAAPRQVLVDDFPIDVAVSVDGTKKFITLLSDLIPAAIQNDSPIKERGGRLYRPNVRHEASHHHIGKIDAVLSGTAKPLFTRWLDDNEVAGVEVTQPLNGDAGSTQPMIERLEFTGAGSDVPLDIANNCAMRNPFHLNTPAGLRERFAAFLHQQIKEAVDGIPDYKLEWARCSFAGQMRERYMLQRAIFEFLTGWGRTGGGFTVPKGYQELDGVSFKKDFVYEVLNIKSSSASDTDKWFSPNMLENAPAAKEWVATGGGTHDDRFNKMKSARFKEYLREDHRDEHTARGSGKSSRRRRSSISTSPGPSRKHRRSDDDTEEDRQRRGGRNGKRLTSQDLDWERAAGSNWDGDDKLITSWSPIPTMTATVRDLILILEAFFPGDLALQQALYLLGVILSLYPLFRLHRNQQRQPPRRARTAWLSSIRDLLVAAFQPEDAEFSIWASGLDRSGEYADYISDDLGGLRFKYNPNIATTGKAPVCVASR